MQFLFLGAGLLALMTGIVHSVLGETLIFKPLRSGGFVPSRAVPPLSGRHIRIIWASWHLGSLFSWAFAAVLLRLATASQESPLVPFVLSVITVANLGGSLLVLVATRGRHPGWVALLVVAALVWIARMG